MLTYTKLVFLLGRFPAIANHGRHFRPVSLPRRGVPDGVPTRIAGINSAFWQNTWQSANALPATFGSIRQPDQYVNEQIGSDSNPTPFVILQDAVNGVKGRIENFKSPMAQRKIRRHIKDAAAGNRTSVENFMAPLRQVNLPYQLQQILRDVNILLDSGYV